MPSSVLEVIIHCQKQIKKELSEEKLLHYLRRLSRLRITIDDLRETGVGKTVNQLSRLEGKVGQYAGKIVEGWKEMVETETETDKGQSEESSEASESEPELEIDMSHVESSPLQDDGDEEEVVVRHEEEDDDSVHEGPEEIHEPDEDVTENRVPYIKEEPKGREEEKVVIKNEKIIVTPHKFVKREIIEPEEESRSSRERHGSNAISTTTTEKDHRHNHSKERHHEKQRNRDEKKSSKKDRDDSSSREHHRKRDKDHHHHHRIKEERDQDRPTSKDHKHDKSSSSSRNDKHKSSGDKYKSAEKGEKKVELLVKIKEEKNGNGNGEVTKDSSSDEKHSSSKRKKPETVSEDKQKSSKKLKVMSKLETQEIDSTSGINFSDVLGCLDKPKVKSNKKPSTVPSSSKSIKKNGLLESKSTILPPVKTEPLDNDSLGKQHRSALNNNSSSSIFYESYAPPVYSIQPPKPSPIFQPLDLFPEEKSSRTKWEDNLLAVHGPTNDYEALSSMMSSRKDRTKVYSGNKMGFKGDIPSLFDMCIRTIQENLDSLGFTGGVPYDILKPALARASIKQLTQIEFYNPYLIESTDELWKLHCQRECRMQKPQEMESWRDLYYRYQDEKQEKLKSLASKVKKNVELAQPVRKTKLAYVEPSARGPKFSKSKAATIKNGMKSLKHREEKGGQTGGPSYSASAGGKTQANQTYEEAAIVISADSRARSAPAPSIPRDAPAAMKKPKRAPLMAKTMKLIKQVYRR